MKKIYIAGKMSGEPDLPNEKCCSSCKKIQPLTEFYPKKNRCRLCLLDYARQWRAANPERVLETQRRNDKKRAGTPRRSNPPHIRRHKLKSRYGLTVEQYEAMFHRQNGRCSVCGALGSLEPGTYQKNTRLHVDHNHQTGKVRDLLCGHCNRAEGLLRTPEVCDSLAAYLRRHAE